MSKKQQLTEQEQNKNIDSSNFEDELLFVNSLSTKLEPKLIT